MVDVVYSCGNCRATTVARPLTHRLDSIEVQEGGGAHLQIVVTCHHCQQLNVLHYAEQDEFLLATGWFSRVTEEANWVLNELPVWQNPPLYRPLPAGVPEISLKDAWNEAEAIFSLTRFPTPAGLAYRRVLELAIKELDTTPETREPLGPRAARLHREGRISDELSALLIAAKAFGDQAAHSDALEARDAEIARDLCEAFLHQCFTIPHLLAAATARATRP